MCFGGGGGNQTTSQEFKPPENTRPGWDQYVKQATALSGQPYQSSGIPTVAPWNDFQQAAAQMTYDTAMNGDPSTNAGRGALTGIAHGDQANPWQTFLAGTAGGNSQNPFMAGAAGMAGGSQNPFMAGAQQMAGGQANPFMIDPEAMIKATAGDMTRAAKEGVMAQTDAAFNRAGAYGGSAYNEMQADNQAELGRAVGSMSANARQAANAQNANMWQQGQQNRLAGMGLGNAMHQGNLSNMLQALGLGGGMFSTGLGQQLQAAMGGGQMFGNDINNMLSAAGLAPQYASMDANAAGNLMNMGNAQGQYQQGLLNAGNQEFQNQFMYPYNQNEMFGGALTRASGQGGSSNTSMNQPGYNPYWNALGAGVSLASMYGMP